MAGQYLDLDLASADPDGGWRRLTAAAASQLKRQSVTESRKRRRVDQLSTRPCCEASWRPRLGRSRACTAVGCRKPFKPSGARATTTPLGMKSRASTRWLAAGLPYETTETATSAAAAADAT